MHKSPLEENIHVRTGIWFLFNFCYQQKEASQVVLVVKNSPANTRDIMRHRFVPWVRKVPGGEHGNPLQYSCLENPLDKGEWRAIVHRVAKSRTPLKRLSTQHSTSTERELEEKLSSFFHLCISWNIIALQCCVIFRCTTKCISCV